MGCCFSNHITFEEVRSAVDAKRAGSDILIVDVRDESEIRATGIIPTAINIPRSEVEYALSDQCSVQEFKLKYGDEKPTRDRTELIFYCAHGVRGGLARRIAHKLNYRKTSVYFGSWLEWSEKTQGNKSHPKKDAATVNLAPMDSGSTSVR